MNCVNENYSNIEKTVIELVKISVEYTALSCDRYLRMDTEYP